MHHSYVLTPAVRCTAFSFHPNVYYANFRYTLHISNKNCLLQTDNPANFKADLNPNSDWLKIYSLHNVNSV